MLFFFAPKSRPQPSRPSPFPTIFFGQRLLIPLKRTSLSSRVSGQTDRGCACQVFAPGACGLIKGAALVAEGTQAQTNQHGTQKKILSYRCIHVMQGDAPETNKDDNNNISNGCR